MKKVKVFVLSVLLCACSALTMLSCDKTAQSSPQSSSQSQSSSSTPPEKKAQYTLAFTSENTEQGTVTAKKASGEAVESGAKLDEGMQIVLTATPNTGYAFDGWYLAGQKVSGEATYTVALATDSQYQAKFTLQGYALTFLSEDGQKGTVSANGLTSGEGVPYTTQVTLTATANTGYEFVGWYENGADEPLSTTATYAFAMPPHAYALTAKFTEKLYALAYASLDSEQGSVQSATENGANVPYKSQVTLTATPNAGYEFVGWYEDGSGTPVSQTASYAFPMPAKAYSLTAKFKEKSYALNYAVDYAERGEISSATESGSTVAYQTQITLTATEKTGYDFIGWFEVGNVEPVETSTTYTFAMPASAYSVTAKFAPEKRYVYFNDGYDRVHTETVDYNTVAELYEIEKDNHNFLGWFTSPSFAEVYDSTKKVTENITLYACWEILIITHDVVFVDDDGSPIGGVQKIVDGESIIMRPANPSKTGYNFTGWVYYDEATDEYLPLTADLKVYQDMTISASYEIQKFNVSFYLNEQDRNPYEEYEVEYNKKATRPTTPTDEEYLFVKWVYFDNQDAEFDFQTQITEDIEVLAVWVEKPAETFTVSFYDEENGNLIDTQTVEKNSAATAPSEPQKVGYDFTGWSTEFDCITENTVVYALYKIKTFKVVFKDYNGNVLNAEQTVNYNAAAVAPTQPTRAGYTFIGWSCAFNAVTEDLTVVAQYEIHTFTVIFWDDDAEIGRQEEVAYNTVAEVPATPSKAGYSFIGWYADTACNTPYDFNTAITEDKNVYAKFEIIVIAKYTVVFRQPDGELISQQTVVEGKAAIEPGSPVKEGYTFTGWDKVFDNVTSNLEIIAQYDKNSYAVRFFDADERQIGQTVYVGYDETAASVQPDLSVIPTINGKQFRGWDKDINNFLIKEETDFYAEYVNETRTVYFHKGDGTVTQVTVEYGTAVNIPNTPSKTGYIFKFWKLNGATSAFDFSTAITEDTNLYAEYGLLVNMLEVRFIGADGNPYGNVQVVAIGRYAIEPAPYEDGTQTQYVWCWENGEAFDFENTPIENSIILYAKPING